MKRKSTLPFHKWKMMIPVLSVFMAFAMSAGAQNTSWPEINKEMRAGTRWWWLGSAVDKTNLTWNLEEYARKGMGSVEITPIYGVQNNDANNIDFLSPKWMEILKHTIAEGERVGIQVDMNHGTGWPFGGPEVTLEDAASKLLIREYSVKGKEMFSVTIEPIEANQKNAAKLLRLMAFQSGKALDITKEVDAYGNINWVAPKGDWKLIAAFNGKTFQKVKRAAPGGEGYVIDHMSAGAVNKYLRKFEKAFEESNTPYPHNFFNDSYEVYGADWTEDLFEQFYNRRGYKLEFYLREFLSDERTDVAKRVVSDYRETIAELVLENFTQQWTEWAHQKGSKTRNQAHGSPGNLIDLYAVVDVPECEGFGLSDFNIKGLRKDSLTRKNDSDLSMLKYASSAANIAGKPYVSSESFTWLTEHFRTSLSQCKPDLDLLFVAGINHMNFHGTPYSPREAAWPGWLFYATVNMSPTNSIWRDASGMFDYIARSQSFLQMGKSDNDFLIYVPVYDIWHEQSGRYLMFDIHKMDRLMPKFIDMVHSIYQSGFDVDYISDNFIRNTKCVDGKLVTEGGAVYESLILPAVKIIPDDVLKHIVTLAEQGAKIVFIDHFPNDVPGMSSLKKRRSTLAKSIKKLNPKTDFSNTQVRSLKSGKVITGSDFTETLLAIGKQPEEMITRFGLHALRRSNADGHHYFISGLHEKDINDWITINVPMTSAMFFDPLTGKSGKAATRVSNGKSQVRLQLKSGQSIVLKIFAKANVNVADWKYYSDKYTEIPIVENWTLSFVESYPTVSDTFKLKKLESWTNLQSEVLKINSGTGVYETSFSLAKKSNASYVLDLGDVRESARLFVNGQDAGILWAVPYLCDVTELLKDGINTLKIEVTNLPANRIADYDRRNVEWRIFNEINMVDINYKKTGYAHWATVESGLCGPVKLVVFE